MSYFFSRNFVFRFILALGGCLTAEIAMGSGDEKFDPATTKAITEALEKLENLVPSEAIQEIIARDDSHLERDNNNRLLFVFFTMKMMIAVQLQQTLN